VGIIRLSTRAVLCIFSFATLTVQAHAQVTSQINVTSRSLVVEPATNDYAAPGGVTTFLTTYDGWDGLPLYPFSGEVRPLYLGSTEYVTDYEGHLGIMDPSLETLLNYGELVISNMPVAADSDGDGLPNFLEVNLASSFSVDAADREDYRFDGNTNNSEWTLSFARAAGSSQGNYTLKKKSDPNNPEKIWNGNYHLKGATGSLVFNTNNKTFSFTIDSYDRVYPETNHATGAYGITQTGQLLMHGFWMESSLGTNQKKYINPFLAERIASGDRGRAVLYSSDGHPYNPSDPSTTPYPDYTEFHLELTNFPASITQTPNALSPLPWNDEFTSSNSSANYLDFRNSHFAGLEVSGGKLNLTASANQYGDAYGNLSIYSPPHLLLPLSASWDISVQVSLPEPDGAYYKGVGVSLTPENETYDIANFGATVYSFELGQDNDPATPGTFLATHARKDWMPDSNLSRVTSVNFNTTYLRFAYDASTKILSSYYDSNVSSPTRSWSLYQELDLDPTDPNSVAGNLGLTSSSQIRMALWADAFVTNAISTNQIWMDSLSITQNSFTSPPIPPPALTNGIRAYLDQAFVYAPVWSNAVSFSATGLPPGLNNNSSSGAISGTPSQAGYFRAIQTAHNGTNSNDFTIPITIPGMPLSLPFSDDFSIEVPNRYMPYDFSNLLEEPEHYPSAGRLSLRPTNGVLRVICPANSPGHHSIGHVANLNLPLSLSWELLLDVKIPNTFSTLESQLGLCLYPAPSAEDTVETLGSQNQLNFYFNRDTEFPESSDYGSGLERNTYINGVSQINDDGWLQLNTNSLATLRIFYDCGQKTISTWGKPQPDGSWTKIGVDIPFDPEASGTLAHRWGLSPTSTLGVTITGYFEVGASETLPEIYADNFSAKIIQSLSEIFFGNLDPTNVASDGLTYLMKYAYGAANPTSPISHALRPVTTLTTNTNGQPVLALTYYARTNDTNLLIQPIWSSELTSPTSSWQSNVTVNTLGVTNTNGLVLEQRKATVPIDSTAKKFLRLKATLNK